MSGDSEWTRISRPNYIPEHPGESQEGRESRPNYLSMHPADLQSMRSDREVTETSGLPSQRRGVVELDVFGLSETTEENVSNPPETIGEGLNQIDLTIENAETPDPPNPQGLIDTLRALVLGAIVVLVVGVAAWVLDSLVELFG